MAVLRLANGSDVVVKLTVAETVAALEAEGQGFVVLPGEDGEIHLRASSVLAVIEDARRGTAGFRLGVARAAE